MIVTIASLFLLMFYVVLISIYHYGWIHIKSFNEQSNEPHSTFSIIIPARNEEGFIATCIESVLLQQYPESKFEIIIIDDHSTDGTSKIAEKCIAEKGAFNARIIKLTYNTSFVSQKKAAITHAISLAKSKYIILTDADCTRGNQWLSSINNFLHHKKSKMVYAPVEFNAHNMYEKIQSMEFAGLVAIGGAAIRLKNPNMCSAANLIFEKKLFEEVNGYQGNEDVASGDDEFLLHKAFKLYPEKIHFLKNRLAIVKTNANVSLAQLASQRKRWVSKSTKYENRYITAILVGAYLFNFSILFNLIFNFKFGLFLLAAKTITEGVFLYNVMNFFGNKRYLLFLPLAEIFHILYVLIIGIWANIGTYQWKERNVK